MTTKRKSPSTIRRRPLPTGTELLHVRRGVLLATATITNDGVRYAGRTYPSLSAAASAAAKKLGKHASVNGFVFWSAVAS